MLVFAPRPKWVRAREVYELPEVRDPRKAEQRVRYSLLVPAFHEGYLDTMFSYVADSRRRDFEVLLLVHPDDDLTLTQARTLENIDPHQFRVIQVSSSPPILAADLNEGLPHCNGEAVGVLEVYDPLSPSLIDRVDGAFRASGADVVRLSVDVPHTLPTGEILQRTDGLVQVRGRSPVRVTEHYWRGHSSGYFVRTDLLRLLGGWDDACVTEELELMLRLFSYGATGAVLYGQETRVAIGTTPAPVGTQARMLFRRRIRQYVGLLQIYRTGEWPRIPDRHHRWAARTALLLPLVRDLVGNSVVLLILLSAPIAAIPLAVQLVWAVFLSGLLISPDFGSVLWLRRQSGQRRHWWTTMRSLPVKSVLDFSTRTPAALVALSRILNAHFERSRHEPPPRHHPPEPPSAPSEVPPDLLDLASSPYTPAAAQTLATGLENLFTTLGPPPEAQRLAGTGPAPKGDGGAGDG
ncbi:glycosyltransferase [Streptomyces acidiscabies]|uniref:glycosyltransferase n=1 Tax=Streptomyces acidiscabies TaxID=42234 RepID=UPI00095134CE|nr:glycosyltransferase family 2 protein [Streptomyces acidiscabies]